MLKIETNTDFKIHKMRYRVNLSKWTELLLISSYNQFEQQQRQIQESKPHPTIKPREINFHIRDSTYTTIPATAKWNMETESPF